MNELDNHTVSVPRVDAPKVTARPTRLGRPERRALRHCVEGTSLPRTEAIIIAMGNLARMGLVAPNETRAAWVATEKGQQVYEGLEERRGE